MFWLALLAGVHVLGFGFTLSRLAYDEWQQKRMLLAEAAPALDGVSEMRETENVISIGQGAANLGRAFANSHGPKATAHR